MTYKASFDGKPIKGEQDSKRVSDLVYEWANNFAGDYLATFTPIAGHKFLLHEIDVEAPIALNNKSNNWIFEVHLGDGRIVNQLFYRGLRGIFGCADEKEDLGATRVSKFMFPRLNGVIDKEPIFICSAYGMVMVCYPTSDSIEHEGEGTDPTDLYEWQDVGGVQKRIFHPYTKLTAQQKIDNIPTYPTSAEGWDVNNMPFSMVIRGARYACES